MEIRFATNMIAVEGLATQSSFLKQNRPHRCLRDDDCENKFGFWLEDIGAHLALSGFLMKPKQSSSHGTESRLSDDRNKWREAKIDQIHNHQLDKSSFDGENSFVNISTGKRIRTICI